MLFRLPNRSQRYKRPVFQMYTASPVFTMVLTLDTSKEDIQSQIHSLPLGLDWLSMSEEICLCNSVRTLKLGLKSGRKTKTQEIASLQPQAPIGLPLWLSSKESACSAGDAGDSDSTPIRKMPRRRKRQPTPVFLPERSHGQRNLVGYSPWGCKRVRHD